MTAADGFRDMARQLRGRADRNFESARNLVVGGHYEHATLARERGLTFLELADQMDAILGERR